MEIMKVFSDYYDDERIYSVLMDEDEMYLFSQAVARVAGKLKNGNMIFRGDVKKLADKTSQQYGKITRNGYGSLSPARQKMVNNGLASRENLMKKAMKSNPGEFYPGEIKSGYLLH